MFFAFHEIQMFCALAAKGKFVLNGPGTASIKNHLKWLNAKMGVKKPMSECNVF